MAPSVEEAVNFPPVDDTEADTVSIAGVVYISVMLTMLTFVFMLMCFKWVSITGQKTRNPQQRRLYAGSRPRPSLSTHEPTIYVSPSNLPPPPKYEFMAPPSYEEVVGVHYPNLQTQQPITQPIATALAQSTQPTTTNNTRTDDSVPTTNDSATTNNAATTNDPVVRVHETVVVTVNERQTATTS